MSESVFKLKVESSEYENKIRRAAQGVLHLGDSLNKAGKTFSDASKEEVSFVQALGKMETSSRNAKGRVSELSNAFVDLSAAYRRMTDQEKATPVGRALSASLEQLRQRTVEAKRELEGLQGQLNNVNTSTGGSGGLGKLLNGSGLGSISSVFSQIGSQVGISTDLLTSFTAGTFTASAGIAALAAAEGAAVKQFIDFNNELARQQQITTVTTGLSGGDADNMTAGARALAKVYGVDFREAINAANTLMTQFGETGDAALQLLRDGMQGMINGDGPKLLSMIQQYAPSFRDAGISASQLVAVIQNSEGGIFTDQNMNAIVMGIKNIRLMTNATAEALRQVGINGEDMSRQLNDGTITVFDALKNVAEQLQTVDSNSKTAGEVMQQVFGRQGTMAGTNLAKAIETLNLNLQETKRQTGGVGEAMAGLELATEELERSMQKAFAIEGWEQLKIYLETSLVKAITLVTDALGSIDEAIEKVSQAFGGKLTEYAIRAALALSSPLMMARELLKLTGSSAPANTEGQNEQRAQNLASNMIGNINRSDNKTASYSRYRSMLENTASAARQKGDEIGATVTERTLELLEEAMDKTFSAYGSVGDRITKGSTTKTSTTSGGKSKQQQASDMVASAEQDYERALQKAAMEVEAGTVTSADALKKELSAKQSLWEAYNKAYNVYADDDYKTKQDELKNQIVALGGEVTQAVSDQNAANRAARELEQAQQKLADAQKELSNAGNLKEQFAAEGKIEAAQKNLSNVIAEIKVDADTNPAMEKIAAKAKEIEGRSMEVPVTVKIDNQALSRVNLNALKQKLQTEIDNADFGTELYNNLTAKLNDVTALASLIETCVNNGIDSAQFNTAEIWQKILWANGDAIPESVWLNIGRQMGGGNSFNSKTNTFGSSGDKSDTELMSQMVSGLSSVSGGLEQMGIKVPDSVKNVISAIQGVITVIQGVNTFITAFNAISQVNAGVTTSNTAVTTANTSVVTANTGAITALTGAVIANTTALGTNTVTNIIPYAGGGIVKAATGIIVPGNSMSNDRVPALLNSGELILNQAEQGIVADALNEAGTPSGDLATTSISGEDIWIVVSNFLQRSGYGEILTSRNR